MMKMAIIGRTSGPYTESGKVCTQMKEAAGAESIPLRSKYPHAAAMMHPVRRPITTLVDFIMGEPKRSHRMIVMNTEKPRPRYSAEPQGRAWGALMFGQRANNPSVGLVLHGPLPPAQFWNPLSIKLIPINITVGPVTIGGKILSMTFGGMKLIKISSSAQQAAVPMIAP